MLKKILIFASVSVIASYLFAKLIEKRSYQSFLYEIMIRATKMKQPFEKKINAQKALASVKAQTQGEYAGTDYNFDNAVYTKKLHDITNYVVNDREDHQQKVVIYIHGGAWFQDPLPYHFEYIDMLATAFDAKVIMPIYPKIPHATYKETFELLEEIYRYELDQKMSSERIVIMGDSAGGQIALSFAQYLKTLDLPQPSDIVMISPVLDGTFSHPEIHSYEKIDPMLGVEGSKYLISLWADKLSLTDWRVSPIYGTFNGLGRMTISIGTKETLYPDAVKLSLMLNAQGIHHNFIPGYQLFHIHPIFPIPERAQFIKKLKKIID